MFFVFWYSRLFGAHATSNISIYGSIQEVTFCSPPPCPPPLLKWPKMTFFLKLAGWVEKRKKNPTFFFWNFHFLGVFFYFFCFFWGVLDHVLRPPCRRYRGDSFTKKVGNAKNQFTYFRVFRYLKPFGAHATSNVCIYFRQKPFYSHPVGDRAECLLQKR